VTLHGTDMPSQAKGERLFDRLERQEQASRAAGGVFVPVDDFGLYCVLANEIAQAMATAAERRGLVILGDAVTCREVDAIDTVRRLAERAYHFGDTIPREWAVAPNTLLCEPQGEVTRDDRFFVSVSPNLSFAILGVAHEKGEDGQPTFRGGWTGQPDVVSQIAAAILRSSGRSEDPALPVFTSSEPIEHAYACSVRLMRHMVRRLSSRQRDIAQTKDDLSSVLNILKAISAQRRAHDILYVFVDQIAQIVGMSRCSVVRVWGGETTGHVLASHEDANVHDLAIDLDKYPEIHRSMETRDKVVINDVLQDPLTRPFAKDLRRSGITSLVVIPIVLFDQNVGSFLLRTARANGPFSMREIGFCEIVAEAAANALERAHLFETVQRANERLEFLAITDGLTGLYNHRFFRDRLDEEFERARRYELPLSCLMIDVDNFKDVNDTYGHLTGDSILREIALRTTQMVRKSDMVARYGGEEFIVIMPQTGREGARAEAERIRREIGSRPYDGLPEDTRVTVSIGVATYDRESMADCEEMLRIADLALYEAKRAGKDCIAVGEMPSATANETAAVAPEPPPTDPAPTKTTG